MYNKIKSVHLYLLTILLSVLSNIPGVIHSNTEYKTVVVFVFILGVTLTISITFWLYYFIFSTIIKSVYGKWI